MTKGRHATKIATTADQEHRQDVGELEKTKGMIKSAANTAQTWYPTSDIEISELFMSRSQK